MKKLLAPTSIFISDYIEKPPLPVSKSPVPVAETPPEVKVIELHHFQEKERIKAEEITCELQPSPTPPKKAVYNTVVIAVVQFLQICEPGRISRSFLSLFDPDSKRPPSKCSLNLKRLVYKNLQCLLCMLSRSSGS
ncbi:unnamed protein product [Cylicostephanus goldi]|uniref:Uncharacterized protein n=1 Tax=Cylicostephanus goldi TaxID=71465 RepID=A0A3P7MV58_CYLGO|nr:unnamed protein product [Cylicostephanus goldi]